MSISAQSVDWITNFETAKQRALAEHKLILADFWAVWCGPCLAMDHQVWNQNSVRNASEHLIPLRLDFDKEFLLNNRYEVTAIPAMLILDGYGNKLFHLTGYKSEDQMVSILKSLPSKMEGVYHLLKRSLASPDSIELVRSIADQYQLLNVPQVSNAYYEKVLDDDRVEDDGVLRNRIHSRMALNYHLLGDNDEAADLLEECVENDLQSPDRPMQLFLLTKISLIDNDHDRAMKYLDMLKSDFPDDKHRAWAEGLFGK